MLKLLKILLIIAGGFLIFANIEPYIAVTRLIFGGSSGIDVCAELRPLPFIGGLLQGGCGFLGAIIYSLSGFIVWAIFQIVELLPIANSFNIPFLSNLLSRMQKAPQVDEYWSDRDSVRQIKQKHNSVVERSLGALLTFSWVMYLLDFALMSWLYSPLSETGELDIKALMRVLLGVLGVEVVILGLNLISNIIDPTRINYQQAQQKPAREY
jgi:hypothetical protein